ELRWPARPLYCGTATSTQDLRRENKHMANDDSGRKTVELALQGGGAHGALTWGVLERLLEEPKLHIEGVSGTSAGAMNAVVLADGLEAGGADGARAALERFWRTVS